jgi:hypothetical protein
VSIDIHQAKRQAEVLRRGKEHTRREVTLQARRAKRKALEAQIVESLERVREGWRRLEAHSDQLGTRNGDHHELAQSLGEPTPERKAKAANGVGEKVIGRRIVKRLLTTADILELEPRSKARHLPKHLRAALDQFTAAVAEAMGVNVADEGHASSARMVSGYDGMLPGAYGPRDTPDRVLNARHFWRCLEREIPPEMMEVLNQLVGEETGLLQGRPAPLQKYGNDYGWDDDRQAYAAGGMHAIDACAVLHHAIKRDIGRRKDEGRP